MRGSCTCVKAHVKHRSMRSSEHALVKPRSSLNIALGSNMCFSYTQKVVAVKKFNRLRGITPFIEIQRGIAPSIAIQQGIAPSIAARYCTLHSNTGLPMSSTEQACAIAHVNREINCFSTSMTFCHPRLLTIGEGLEDYMICFCELLRIDS